MVENRLQREVILCKRTDGKNGHCPGRIRFRCGLILHDEFSCTVLRNCASLITIHVARKWPRVTLTSTTSPCAPSARGTATQYRVCLPFASPICTLPRNSSGNIGLPGWCVRVPPRRPSRAPLPGPIRRLRLRRRAFRLRPHHPPQPLDVRALGEQGADRDAHHPLFVEDSRREVRRARAIDAGGPSRSEERP